MTRAPVALLAVTCGLAVASGVSPAKAADEPVPTTTTVTYTEPTPDPAPIPRPAPKPKPKPKPKPYQPRSSTPSPAPTTVVRSQPTVQTRATKPATKKRVVHRKKHQKHKLQRKRAAPLPKVAATRAAQSGVLGAQTAVTLSADGSFDLTALLIVAALSLTIVCFGIAAVPAAFVPWRRAAWFVANEHLNMTILGFAFLLAVAVALLTGSGS